MKIVILVGGHSSEGNLEHRFLVAAMLDQFGPQISHIITANPVARPWTTRLRRLLKRGRWVERIRRRMAGDTYGPSQSELAAAFTKQGLDAPARMPGADKLHTVEDHNGEDCLALLSDANPDVMLVYGTAVIADATLSQARLTALNMHTGLSPWYRGDSTLFWPVYYDQEDKLGVTVHRLTAKIDGGDIVATAPVAHEAGDTEADLFAKGVREGTRLYVEAVAAVLDGTIHYQQQDLARGREFSWRDRTVAAERVVAQRLRSWDARKQERRAA